MPKEDIEAMQSVKKKMDTQQSGGYNTMLIGVILSFLAFSFFIMTPFVVAEQPLLPNIDIDAGAAAQATVEHIMPDTNAEDVSAQDGDVQESNVAADQPLQSTLPPEAKYLAMTVLILAIGGLIHGVLVCVKDQKSYCGWGALAVSSLVIIAQYLFIPVWLFICLVIATLIIVATSIGVS